MKYDVMFIYIIGLDYCLDGMKKFVVWDIWYYRLGLNLMCNVLLFILYLMISFILIWLWWYDDYDDYR